MAHLTRCWCGKIYRCERTLVKKGRENVLAFVDTHMHDECPDFIFHGQPSSEWFKEIRSNG